jgi:hypothetical protein
MMEVELGGWNEFWDKIHAGIMDSLFGGVGERERNDAELMLLKCQEV